MKAYLFLLFFVVCLFVPVSAVHASEKIKLTTTEWKPYVGSRLKNQGYVAELVIAAFKCSGKDVEIIFVPWARAVRLAEAKAVDGYFPEYYSDNLKKNFFVSDPFPGGPLGFFKRKGERITIKRLTDLKPYKIGVVRGYINTAEFDAAHYLMKDEATDDLMNFNKLIKGRIDLVVCDKFVGQFLLKQELSSSAERIEFVSPPLEEKKLYICIGKNGTNSEQNIKAFNDGLKEMKADGSIAAIIKKNGL